MVKIKLTLVDAIYINNSGGKVLLDYLINSIVKKKLTDHFYFLLDQRAEYTYLNEINYELSEPSMMFRFKFYLKNKNKFNKVLCFANIPPLVSLKRVEVFTYFHNVLLLNLPENYSLKNKIKSLVRRSLFFLLKRNTNYWVVQSDNVKTFLNERANICKKRTLIYPFFSLDKYDVSKKKFLKNSFIYPSTGAIHKNHLVLLYAWERLFDQGFKPKLSMTIKFPTLELETEIERLKIKGLDIVNLGEMKFDDLKEMYKKNEYLVFPSLFESFGLPMIEAINYGCKVIASNLPYVHEIISPSAVFNPRDEKSIEKSIIKCMNNKLPESEILVKNKINEMIDFLLI